ncbi:cell division protein SepF [Calditerricola satsumensis]|uniref:Cell division protein SepF n=1 Tax=Calditerricola satsumensis TaxID=373054 RepID=A0A8J3B613_9BACI|nr:cell division protein SepF [Calditerricola satsumensis]GGJ92209.1 cell division protein SepF [Calditerricola satsumensis]
MGMMNRLLGFFGLQDEVTEERVLVTQGEEEDEAPAVPSRPVRGRGNVVNLHAVRSAGAQVILCEPRSYEETQEIADHLRNRRAVVVNLHRVTPEMAKRIVDFLSGTVYAIDGLIQKVGPQIFLCTPDNVEVHGTITHPDAPKTER